MFEIKKEHIEQAKLHGANVVSHYSKKGYLLYKLKCGHEQEVARCAMKEGRFKCQSCHEEVLKGECFPHKIIGKGRDANYRVYQLACGHEQEITIRNMRTGSYSCLACTEIRLREECKPHRLTDNPCKPRYRVYELECGHVQEIRIDAIRENRYTCRECGDHWWTQPSYLYLIKIQSGNSEWLKAGFARCVQQRVRQYGIPEGYSYDVLYSMRFEDAIRAKAEEKRLFDTFHTHRVDKEFISQYHTRNGYTECFFVEAKEEILEYMKGIDNV